MTTKTITEKMVIEAAGTAGRTCYEYIRLLLDKKCLSEFELNLLFEIFNGNNYLQDVLDAACYVGLEENIETFDEFEELLYEVETSFRYLE